MRIRRRPMQIRDVQACVELMASRPLERKRYGDLLGQLTAAWKGLLRTGVFITGVIEDAETEKPSILSFGVSVFVTDEFLAYCKIPTLRWIGPELLRWRASGKSPILGANAVREANARGGLNLVAWAAALFPRNESERMPLQIELMNGFMQEHLGYKLKEIISQPIEQSAVEIVLNSGGFLWNASRRRYLEAQNGNVEDLMRHPFALGSDRETATQHLNWTTTLFQYNRPRIYFRPAEQRLLLVALNGSKDEELSDELRVSLSFVKKTWSSIYARAAAKLPELNLELSNGRGGQRGKEKKQHMLSYLREHPEELRPIIPE